MRKSGVDEFVSLGIRQNRAQVVLLPVDLTKLVHDRGLADHDLCREENQYWSGKQRAGSEEGEWQSVSCLHVNLVSA